MELSRAPITLPVAGRRALAGSEYFRSGWAFFVPYLVAYLLYAATGWPVQTRPDGAVPSLTRVFAVLHVAHLAGAVFVFGRRPSDWFGWRTVLAWIGIALVFAIPGIYLEWPADPWEHLRRINAWAAHENVTAHSAWAKSGYYFQYTLVGMWEGLSQRAALTAYYVAINVLLAWQYYRLARAVGLNESTAFVFVALTTVTLGNNVFSFYRYYGLSPSILAQIGAVALTRVAAEWISGLSPRPPESAGGPAPSARFLLPTACLGLLTGFNHVQGLGFAALGLMAALAWRLVAWRRVAGVWLVLGAVLASLAVAAWLPRHPAIDTSFRPQGWLTSWYGFDLFSATSPAFARSAQILGLFGLVNLAAGIWLVLRRNHLVGWITLMPVLALLLPCFSLPLAHLLATRSTDPGAILPFHRVLLAIPAGLALVTCCSVRSAEKETGRWRPTAPLLAAAAALTLIWPGYSAHRVWHSLHSTSADLELRHITGVWSPVLLDAARRDATVVAATPLANRVREVLHPGRRRPQIRHIRDELSSMAGSLYLPLQAVFPDGHWTLVASLASAEVQLLARTTPIPTDVPCRLDFVSDSRPWRTVGGIDLERVDIGGEVALANPRGATSQALSPLLTPIIPDARYRAVVSVRQDGEALTATNYLGLAWYDRSGRFLTANEKSPSGAGNPPGWSNGTYSYFGPRGTPSAEEWSTYSIDFGLGEAAVIPPQAAYVAAAILLNYNSREDARTLVREFRLERRPAHLHVVIVAPPATRLVSPHSTAARLSGHWSPQRVARDATGAVELAPILKAARTLGEAGPSPRP